MFLTRAALPTARMEAAAAERLQAKRMADRALKVAPAVAKPAGGERARLGDWKSLELGSARERFKRRELLWTAPTSLRRAIAGDDARGMLFDTLGVTAGGRARLYDAPDGQPVVINPNVVTHIINKFDDHREIFANRILPTLDADEIWRVEHKPGRFRRRFIKFWSDGKATLAIVDDEGNVLFNFMPHRNIDSQRKGELVYRRPEKARGE